MCFLVLELFIYLSDHKWASLKGLGSVVLSSQARVHPPLTTDDETQLHMFQNSLITQPWTTSDPSYDEVNVNTKNIRPQQYISVVITAPFYYGLPEGTCLGLYSAPEIP